MRTYGEQISKAEFRYDESWYMLREILFIVCVTSVMSPPSSAVPLNLPESDQHQSTFKFTLMDEEEPGAKVEALFFSALYQSGLHRGSRHPPCFHDEPFCYDRMLLVICRHGYRLLMPFSNCFCAVQLSNLWRCHSCAGVEPWQWVLRASCPLSLTTSLWRSHPGPEPVLTQTAWLEH